MAQQSAHPDGEVLPFDKSDVVNAVGSVERIVALSGYTDEEGVYRGRCNYCGYDRGTYKSHTEVAAWSLTCRECGAVIGGEE
jgi:hypothetical protein